MINFSKWIPSSDGSSTFSNFLTWINNLLENIVNFVNDEKIIFGTYTGDGTENRIINLGFTPAAVEVYRSTGEQYAAVGSGGYFGGLAINGYPCGGSTNKSVEVVTNGFKVSYAVSGSGIYPRSNQDGLVYYFIAFKNGQIVEV